MTTIELTAEVGADHRLTVEVPPSCPPGRHRLLLFVEPVNESAPVTPESSIKIGETASDVECAETPLAWENGVLVYTGKWVGPPIEDMVAWEREQRMRDILGDHSQ